MANRHMKRYLTLLIIREIKGTMRYHFMLVRMVIIKKKKNNPKLQTINAGEGVEKREPSCTVGGNVN